MMTAMWHTMKMRKHPKPYMKEKKSMEKSKTGTETNYLKETKLKLVFALIMEANRRQRLSI